jgi:predicted amidohydrolase
LEHEGVNFGLAICYELSVKEHQDSAIKNGANVYIASAVESVEGIEKSLNNMSNTSKKYCIPSLLSNSIGLTGKYNCAGKSSIWNEHGELVDQLNILKTGILVYDLNTKQSIKSYL